MIIKDLSLDEINQIILALAEEPYKSVVELIPKIQGQAQAQLIEVAPTIDLANLANVQVTKANGKPETQPEAAPSPGDER